MTDPMLIVTTRVLTIYLISAAASHFYLRDLFKRHGSRFKDRYPHTDLKIAADVICFIPIINTSLVISFLISLLFRAINTVRLAAMEKKLDQNVEKLIKTLDARSADNAHKVVDQMLASGQKILVVVSVGNRPDEISVASIDGASDDEVISALNEAIDMFRDKNNCAIMRIPPPSNPSNN